MDIGYVNARVRGMKRQLLDRDALEQLMHKPDIESIIAELEKTPYKKDIEQASVQFSGIHCIEEALRTNLASTSRLLLRFVTDESYEKYVTVFLNRWDVHNIKTILRGKNIHIDSDEILESLVPAGELDEVTLIEMVKQPDVRGVIDLLATWGYSYALPLTRNYERFTKKKDLAVLEYALDKFYFEKALKILKKKSYNDNIARDLIRTEIDVTNIKSALRLVRDHIDTEDGQGVYIEGGSGIDAKTFLSLITAENIGEALAVLNRTPYAFLNGIRDDRMKTGEISTYEKELDRYLIRKGIRTWRGDTLSIAGTIGYIWAKNNEVTNIRIISRCKTAFIPEEELKEELMYV